MEQTMAEKFAGLFDNDGQVFETTDGRWLDDVAEEMGAAAHYGRSEWDEDERDYIRYEVYRGEYFAGDPIRYEFPDGSVVVHHGDGWDFEGDEPFSFRG